MLLDLAILPEVFEVSAYSDPALCGHLLKVLKPVLFEDAVVRDMRNGGWSQWMRNSVGKCHHATGEIVEALIKQRRLGLFPPALKDEPEDSSTWCYEALATHEIAALDAIICGNAVAADFENHNLVQALENVHESDWYKNLACSVRLHRQTADYLKTLRVPLKWCNSAMFIDPYLDPSRKYYTDFYRILDLMRGRAVPPQIEFHRCSFEGSGKDRRVLPLGDVRTMFASVDAFLTGAKMKATVFVWDAFHDRYLITNHIGMVIPNGFDISGDANEMTTWSRLGTKDREDVQREFDSASHRHKLTCAVFEIGKAD